jgi:amino acid adenylation domain-containing protein
VSQAITSKLSPIERERLLALARSFNVKRQSASLPGIEVAKGRERNGLSFAQQRLWFLAQMEGVSTAYHIPMGLHLRGDLHRGALRKALARIVARHEALRTTFFEIDGEPVQRVGGAKESGLDWQEHLGEHADSEEIESLIREEVNTAFDLERGPLIRARLIQQSDQEHTLLVTMHHIISDGWSTGVLIKELGVLYDAFLREKEDPLPELQIQYADYAAWQRRWIEGDVLREQSEYWRKTLTDVPALLEVPGDHLRPADQDYSGASVEIKLEEEQVNGLKRLSKRHGTTLYMTLLAGWAVLLGRLSGQQDIVIGTPVANRNRIEVEPLIGFFVNTLALRVDLSGAPTVSELLAKVKTRALEAQQHQDIPFEQVVEIVRPVRSLAHHPLFQVMFAWQNAAEGRLDLAGLEVGPLQSIKYSVAKFDMTLSLQEAGGQIVGELEYAKALFEGATIERYLGYLRSLLSAMVADDTQVIDELPLLSEEERRRVLYEWNDTAVEYPAEKCVQELFQEQVAQTPEATAVGQAAWRLSYRQLDTRANQVAFSLRELGVGPEVMVGVCMERTPDLAVALMGIFKSGGVYVPIDPEYPPERIQQIVDESKMRVLITDEMNQPRLTVVLANEEIEPKSIQITELLARGEAKEKIVAGQHIDNLAYVIYTSGSTGKPKGVMIPQRGMVNHLWALISDLNLSAEDAVAQTASICFDISVWQILAILVIGGRVEIISTERVREPEQLLTSLEENEVSVVELVPLMIQGILQISATRLGLAKLRWLLTTGEAATAEMCRNWLAKFPHVRLLNAYGPAECSDDVAYCEIQRADVAGVDTTPIGRPIANMRAYILNDRKEPVPIGVAGELYIGGIGLGRGYLGRPELTAERFIPDRFVSEAGARMYRTGDLGRWRGDGNIEFVGRNDFQVKIRGYRIELGEIEARLAEQAGVGEAVVVAREDTAGDQRLVAYYTTDENGGGLGALELRTALAAKLPAYMVPAAYMRLESFPTNVNGKLDTKALPAPQADAYARAGYEAPQGEIEEKLAAIWAEVLKLEQVGRNDNFFELGGHSLLAVRVVNKIQESGFKLSASDLFIHPTVQTLAAVIRVPQGARVVADQAIWIGNGDKQQPLFMAHCGAGEIFYIPLLAQHITSGTAICALPAKPDTEPQMRTVEGMASRMVKMMRDVQPFGPYRIAGWSFGGLLAYEVANQLIGADQEVEFLGIIHTQYESNSYIPQVATQSQTSSSRSREDLFDALLSEAARDTQTIPPTVNQVPNVNSIAFENLLQDCRELALVPEFLKDRSISEIKHFLNRVLALRLAAARYQAHPIPIPIQLFIGQDDKEVVNSFGGWDSVLPTSLIHVINIPGTHDSMMTSPNIECLGEHVSATLSRIPLDRTVVPETRYSPLVVLKQAPPDAPCLFCVPGAGADVTAFIELALSLDLPWPIYGLQPRGMDGDQVPHSTVRAAVESCLRAITSIPLAGNVHLLGHSFGGWIALEVARELRKQQRNIASLTLLDTNPPDADLDPTREYTPEEIMSQWLSIIQQILNRSLGITVTELMAERPTVQRDLLHRRLVEERLMPRGSRPEDLRGPLRSFAAALRSHYRSPEPYPQCVHLVLVDDSKLDRDHNGARQRQIRDTWRRYAPALTLVRAPGNHVTVLKSPHVTTLSSIVKNIVTREPANSFNDKQPLINMA